MRGARAALAAIWGALSLGAAKPPAVVAYTMSPELHHGKLVALDVTMRFPAGRDGRVTLRLPDSRDSEGLWRNIHDLQVKGARSVTNKGPAERDIVATPRAPIEVRYRIVSAYDHDPDVDELDTYKPLIRPTRFWIYGESAFAQVDEGPSESIFRWTGAPAGFGFASDLEQAGGQPMARDRLFESVMVGGPDLKVYRRDLSGRELRVASLGAFDFSMDRFADLTARIIEGERAFWGGREGPFLVAIAPLKPLAGRLSARGEGRQDAFAIQGGANTPLDFLKELLAHEYFHTWNPQRLGGTREGDQEPADYWFSEGFTDFYARKLALRTGVFDLREFTDQWNDMLRAYAASPVRTAPNARVVADFWKDQAVEKLPYQRGAILAAAWDRALRAETGGKAGLDEVMHAVQAAAARQGPRGPKAPDLFAATARRFGLDVSGDVARVVERGEPAVLPADAFGGCLTVVTRLEPTFERGFTVDRAGGKPIIAKVAVGSAAHAAGLRDGMIFVRQEAGRYGDPTTPYRVRVMDGGAERVIAWAPAGKGELSVQHVEIPERLSSAQLVACARAVALAH